MRLVNAEKKDKILYKILGEEIGDLIFYKLKNDISDIDNLSKKEMLKIAQDLCLLKNQI